MYTKKKIADSIVKFINNDVMSDIENSHLKFSLCLAKKALTANPEIMNEFLSNPLIANVIKEENGEYDITGFMKMLKNIIGEYESYSITIPEIPMFAPRSYVKITVEDIDKIMSYLDENSQ